MPKMWRNPNPIFEEDFFPAENDGNMPEITVFADFHWTFVLYFYVFSQKNMIAMPKIYHGLIFNETYFCSRNFL